MIVTYYSAEGKVRMVYHGVAQYDLKGKNVVVLNRYVPAPPAPDVVTPLPFKTWDWGKWHCVAIINLAPGEYLEWKDEPERS